MRAIDSKHYRENLLSGAISASLLAGDAIMQVYTSGFEVSYKEDRSLFTEADKRSQEILASRLERDIPLLSEEGRDIPFDSRKGWNLFWLVDPLDGTKEFVKRNGEFTVNVALMELNKPIAGIIYSPAKRQLFIAARWLGAFRINSDGINEISESIGTKENRVLNLALSQASRLPLHLSDEKYVGVRIIQSVSHVSQEDEDFVSRLRTRLNMVDITSAGSSMKFCLVAEGSADLYPRLGPTMEWDTAAGQCIAEAAGCQVIDPANGLPTAYNKPVLLNSSFLVFGERFKDNVQLKKTVLECANP